MAEVLLIRVGVWLVPDTCRAVLLEERTAEFRAAMRVLLRVDIEDFRFLFVEDVTQIKSNTRVS